MENRRLSDTVGMKSENLHLMRFLASIMVILSHSFVISTGTEENEWFVQLSNSQVTMGGFAVAIFFLCGGYLIAMSAEKNQTAKKFFSARVLRLFPPLIFSTFFTIIICGFFSEYGQILYYFSPVTWAYMKNCIFGRVYYLPGVFTANPYGAVVNGSLWTLPVEFICYILCFIALKLKLTKKKSYPFTVPLVIAGAYVVWFLGNGIPSIRELIRPVLLFYIGMGYWIYREYIQFSIRNFVIAIVAFFVLMAMGQGTLAMLLAFPYIMMTIWFGMKQCSPKIGKLGNYSYGIYLWGFPVQQAVMHVYGDFPMEPMLNALISIPISIVLGIITYLISEKWFMKFVRNVKEVGLYMTLKESVRGIWDKVRKLKLPEWVYVLILVVYSMRHINWGLDLWDTGYNYINFKYMDLEHMDSMWYFSTYLSNLVGHYMTKLPFGDTLMGMNFYTGLIVVALALMGYYFCTRKMKIAPWAAFVGVFVAESLCWSPTAVLYNYVTYILIVACVILIYKGITQDKKWALFLAGVCLGANVLSRFSNLPQMGLILAVWGYGFIDSRGRQEKGALKETINRTLWCIGGYLLGFGSFFASFAVKYGPMAYIEGVMRLFGMTEDVTSYTPDSMIDFVLESFSTNLNWMAFMLKYAIIPIVLWMIIDLLYRRVKVVSENIAIYRALTVIAYVITCGLAVLMIRDLLYGGYFDVYYRTYGCMLNPATTFMLLTMLITIIQLVQKNVSKEEKLIGMLISLMLIFNSLGSSNGVFLAINNFFLAAPYTLWHCYLFIRKGTNKVFHIGKKVKQIAENEEVEEKGLRVYIHHFPLKCILGAFLGLFLVQVSIFGYNFCFAEATGIVDTSVEVPNNDVLAGIKMAPDRAEWLYSISEYVNENDLEGRESIVYGLTASIAYYLDMPPAFNSWILLVSYLYEEMAMDMMELEAQIEAGEVEPPIIIGEATHPVYEGEPKWDLIAEFMEKYDYEITFYNGKFIIWEPYAAQ